MQAETSQVRLSDEHIARVRGLRRAAARRRRILVLSLAAVTVLVLVLAIVLRFSPLFALIPAALLAGALALGVNAAKQAREWERKVRLAKRSQARNGQAVKAPARPVAGDTLADEVVVEGGEAATDVMEQREVRRVLRQAQIAKAQAMALREAADAAEADEGFSHDVQDRQGAAVDSAMSDEAVASADSPAQMREQEQEPQDDHTTQLDRIRPSQALDAFEMAVSQDLISFSLGSPRNTAEERTAEPQSLEIKSMRQVAKAEPVGEATAELISEQARKVAEQDAASFHAREERTDIDPPAATSDSLGAGLESILSRRSA
ncbi:magnesium transporter [Bifidobacterium lemurum]|uniref:magnesium transporter n=1 Tax=Bifidobacterium lemurum TaxID=1603886 RepID=UPI00352073EC